MDTGRTPDEGALLRVVEHLADVPDGDAVLDEVGADDVPDDRSPDDAEQGEAVQDDAEQESAAPDEDAPEEEAPDATAPEASSPDEPGEDAEPSPDDTHHDPEPSPDDPRPDADPDADPDPDPDPEHDDTGPDDVHHAVHDAAHEVDQSQDPEPPDAAPAAPPEYEVGPVAAALSDIRYRIDVLNATERLFLAQQQAMVAELCDDPSDPQLVSALFDRVHEQWMQSDDRPDLRPLADVFGVALGDLVCAQADDLDWATCSDRFGTEIVLTREDPEVLVYPIAAVAQSWHDATAGWFLRHLATVVHGVVPEPAATDG